MSRSARIASPVALMAASLLVLTACGSDSEPASSGTTSTAAPTVTSTAAPASSDAGGGQPSSSVGPSSAGPSAGPSGEAGSAGPTDVTVTLTDADGCVASPDTVPAGVVNFTVKNVDATGITELELVAEQRIIGERENLTPGFTSTFTVKVDGGSYQIYCPGATTERRPFTVTGKAAEAAPSTLTDKLKQATIEYAGYVDDQISFLIPPVEEMQKAIKAGDLKAAQLAYAKARPFYEKIEPVAESFPDLDPAIDLREGDVEAGTEWTGFHPIEKGLFVTKSTKGLDKLADQLLTDIKTLQTQANKLAEATKSGASGGYQAFEIANGASGLLDEVLKSKITGEEEAYSRIDLLDFEANVEGSLQAFATLKPALDEIDPTVVPTISQKFDALIKTLGEYKDPSALGGWTPYDKLTAADKKKLTDALLAVQEPLSKVAAKITQ